MIILSKWWIARWKLMILHFPSIACPSRSRNLGTKGGISCWVKDKRFSWEKRHLLVSKCWSRFCQALCFQPFFPIVRKLTQYLLLSRSKEPFGICAWLKWNCSYLFEKWNEPNNNFSFGLEYSLLMTKRRTE